MAPAAAALTIVRGFAAKASTAPIADLDSDNSTSNSSASPPPPPLRRRMHVPFDDVVSQNCSPVLKAQLCPSVSGIAELRMKMESIEPYNLDSSRCGSMTTNTSSHQDALIARGWLRAKPMGIRMARNPSHTGSESGSTSYEIGLQEDFVSETARDRDLDHIIMDQPPHKMSAHDFEPLRCLGKGTYGTVLLVKQRSTGRLYAQKQFKKASLVVHKKLVEQTKTERQILESVNRHPFVVKLYYAFQDREKLYLILEYGQGGELFTHLSNERMFAEPVAAFYMAEMLLAISHLHENLGVVYRDLKPENCLLDADGHLLLTDFGLSKVSTKPQDSCQSMLGTVEYMAPEVIQGLKYGKAVDWWSFGALAYDLMTGNPPFTGPNHAKIQQNIVKKKLALPYFLSQDAKDLLSRLLRKNPAKRLGTNMPHDLQILRGHRFFRRIDWTRLAARELEPPIRPLITDPELAENFSSDFTNLSLGPLMSSAPSLDDLPWSSTPPKEDVFGGFTFVASSSLLLSLDQQTPLDSV